MEGQANLATLKKATAEKRDILHLACHGVVDFEKPALSGLLLKGDSTDELLSVAGIYATQLNTKLVTLSACETGLGAVHKGEGILGITRAIMFQQVKDAVLSLWPVDDEASAYFMLLFYQHLTTKENTTVSQALFRAKNELRKINQYNQPIYWAAFQNFKP
jgi:CHAT domain-containing protein